jgi:hypothetical protein
VKIHGWGGEIQSPKMRKKIGSFERFPMESFKITEQRGPIPEQILASWVNLLCHSCRHRRSCLSNWWPSRNISYSSVVLMFVSRYLWTRFHPKVLWCQVVKLGPWNFMGISNPGMGIIGVRKENLNLHFGLVPFHVRFVRSSNYLTHWATQALVDRQLIKFKNI